jgi:asparagine synthase (glutamine-hydrolysing)
MCGICGQYNFRNGEPVSQENLKKMTDTIVHRGPDDEGFYVSGSLGLGFRRLSIIDIAGGHQPMSDQENSVWVIFNGEIYNFHELKSELEGHGHVFQTRSDTEVIVHGYKQWGEDVLNHLNGMFGVAIWDEKKKKLVLARDRMGIKMIYYKLESDRLYFGSEMRPIVTAMDEKPQLNSAAVNLFLRYRYTPAPYTIYHGIEKLAPGACLIIENGESRIKRWYQYKPNPLSPMPSVSKVRKDLLELYRNAVKSHLISDVPLGILLSGGMDSGLLLGLMHEFGDDWKTFTVGYGKSFADDELEYAKETADIYGSPHYPVKISREGFEETLSKIIRFLEEPIASSSIVPMYQRSIPDAIRKPLSRALSGIPRKESIRRGLYSLEVPDRMRRYQNVFSLLPGDFIDGLFQDDLLPDGTGDFILNSWEDLEGLMANTDELGGFQFLEIRSSLPDELLMYADKLSMAHSLEVRVPYLDQNIVEYVETLPADFKVRYGTRKWIHRQVCKDYLPSKIIKRKKRGFAVNVVDQWFKESLSNDFDSMLMDEQSLMYNYLKPSVVKNLMDSHTNGSADYHKILFSLIVFEKWLRENSL